MRPDALLNRANLLDARWQAGVPVDHASRIAIVRESGGYRLVASQAFSRGALIFQIDGERSATPTRWSVQVDTNIHVNVGPTSTLEEQIDRFPWRFMNHSCDPNARITGLDVIALRPIQEGHEVTFNYNTTESDMASPFACRCGSARCHGMIRGFAHLNRLDQQRLRPFLSPHLRP